MVLEPVVMWDFAASDGGLASEGDVPQWDWGISTTSPEPVWKTRLVGPYLNDGTDALILALPDLGDYTRPVVVLRHQWDILPGDRGTVELDTGSGWRSLPPVYGFPDLSGFVGDSDGTVVSSFRLDGVGAGARMRFLFSADATFTAAGWTVEQVALYDGDATPPRVRPLETPSDTTDVVGPYRVTVTVEDDTSISSVDVYFRVDGGPQIRAAATPVDGGWSAGIPAQGPGSFVEWHAEASDGSLEGRWPEASEASFRVYLPSPTGLHAEGRLVGQSLYASWDPLPVADISGYEVEDLREGRRIACDDPHALIPVTVSGSHFVRVRGVFDGGGKGDWSAPVGFDIEVPLLDRVFPTTVRRGDLVHLDVTGTSLYLQDDAEISLGLGILVRDLRVLDVGHANAVLQISADAASGPRDLTMVSAWGPWTFPEALTVATDAPAEIVGIEPGKVRQGEAADISVTASEPFAGPMQQIGAAPGILVDIDDPDGTQLTLTVIAAASATPGKHELVLDDGVRWWTVPIEVTESTLSQRTCSTAGASAFPAAIVALLALRRRRLDARGEHEV